MFGSLAPGMPKAKVAKPKKPRKFKVPSMAYRGVTQQPMVDPSAPKSPQVPSAQGGVDDEGGAGSVG